MKILADGNPKITGGGHDGAAVLKGKGKSKEMMDRCLDKTIAIIKKKGLGRSLN